MKAGLKISGPGTAKMNKGLAMLGGAEVLVGIPEGDNRTQQLIAQAAAQPLLKSGKPNKKAQKLTKAALMGDLTNAELLFIFTNGSPVRGQPPRVVIEDAVTQPDTAAMIAKQLAGAAVAALDGDKARMAARLERAGVLGEAASKRWFTNPANNWAPNAPSTIDKKGSDTPGIDTGAMRRAITHIVIMGNAPVSRAQGINGHDVPDGTEISFESGALDGIEPVEVLAVL